MNALAPEAACLLELLLVEPQFVLRRTIVAVAQDLEIARIQEATGIDTAVQRLMEKPFDGIVIDMSRGLSAFKLLSRLRQGDFASPADIAIIAMTSPETEGDARVLALGNALILRKPFRVAELLQRVQRMTRVASLGSRYDLASEAVSRRRVTNQGDAASP